MFDKKFGISPMANFGWNAVFLYIYYPLLQNAHSRFAKCRRHIPRDVWGMSYVLFTLAVACTSTCQLFSVCLSSVSILLNQWKSHPHAPLTLVVHPQFSARPAGAYSHLEAYHRSDSRVVTKEPCIRLTFQILSFCERSTTKQHSWPFLFAIRYTEYGVVIRFGYEWWKDVVLQFSWAIKWKNSADNKRQLKNREGKMYLWILKSYIAYIW